MPGVVLVWEEITFEDGTSSDHIGFALYNHQAVSTSYLEKRVVRHHLTFGSDKNGKPNRKITKVFSSNILSS